MSRMERFARNVLSYTPKSRLHPALGKNVSLRLISLFLTMRRAMHVSYVLTSLNAVSRLNGSGIFDGTTYEYQVSSSSILENRDLRVHFVNVKILFRVINVLENK